MNYKKMLPGIISWNWKYNIVGIFTQVLYLKLDLGWCKKRLLKVPKLRPTDSAVGNFIEITNVDVEKCFQWHFILISHRSIRYICELDTQVIYLNIWNSRYMAKYDAQMTLFAISTNWHVFWWKGHSKHNLF